MTRQMVGGGVKWLREGEGGAGALITGILEARPWQANTLTIGNVTVLSLSDGNMDGPVREMYGDEVARAWGCGCVSAEAEPGFSTNLGSFVIRSGGKTLMVDTGMGDVAGEGIDGEWGSLFGEMKDNKVDASDVDMVFMTHLHFDHTGWNVSRNGSGAGGAVSQGPIRGPRA